jgi:hypothetical protein
MVLSSPIKKLAGLVDSIYDIDGTPRTYRDGKELAIEAAMYLKMKQVHANVTDGTLRPARLLG